MRLRYPPLAEELAGPVTGAPVPIGPSSGQEGTPTGSTGCGCGGAQSVVPMTPTVAEVVVAESPTAAPDLSMAGCCCDEETNPFPSAPTGASGTATGRITWVGVNATRVIQAVAVRQESLGLAPGTPFHVVRLANLPVIGAPLPGVPHVTGVTVEVQEIDGAWVGWHQIDDIFAAGREERAFTLDAATGTITFGSGLTGLRPPRSARIRASYWYGGGPQGQIAIGGIKKSVALPGGFTVANPVPTWGASAGESVADGEAAITRWLRHRDRLVAMEDFTDLTRRTPGVDLGRVETLPLFNPSVSGPPQEWPGMVTVMVIPRSDPVRPKSPLPDRLFLDAVCAWLTPRRLVTTELHVRGPVYVPVWVSIGVVTLPGQVPSIVEQAVTKAVETFLSPLTGGLPEETRDDGLIGARPSTGTGWPLGVSLRAQDIEAVATRVPGVRYVDKVLLAMVGEDGSVVSPVDTVALTGLQLPAATVFCGPPPAVDPATLIAGSQAISANTVPVPVVPDTC